MTRIHEINRLGELDAWRSDWRRLLAQTRGASFFQSLDWLEVYWKHCGQGQHLRAIGLCDGDRPLGILPLVVRSERTRIGMVRFLTYPLDYWGSFYGPVGPEPTKTLAAALEHVLSTKRDWDVLELRWVGGDGLDRQQVEQVLAGLGLRTPPTMLDHTAVIDLGGCWEDYLASRPHKWGHNLRRWQRKLNRLGEVTYLRYRPRGDHHDDADPRWDLYDDCLQVARASWQGASTTGTTLSHESVAVFLRDAHAAAARLGALDVNLLYLDGRPVAFAYNYQYQGCVFGLRVGYDPQYSQEGVGNALYARAIEDSFRRGDRLYDLGPGSLQCKYHLQTAIQPIYRYSYFPPLALRTLPLRVKRRLDSRRMREAWTPRI